MLNRFKFISTSTVITILTSNMVIVSTHKTLANPFSKLLRNIKSVGNSLTLSNPFKTNSSINFNKPYSNGKISSDFSLPQKNLWSKFKNLFNHNNSKSFKINTSKIINSEFQNDEKSSTTTHFLRGNEKDFSKSKERRTHLMSKLENKTSLVENINEKIYIPEKKIVEQSNTFLTVESSELESKLEVIKTNLYDKLDYKSTIKDSIDKTNNPYVKTALTKHLDMTESEIMELQIKMENLQTLLHIIQNNK